MYDRPSLPHPVTQFNCTQPMRATPDEEPLHPLLGVIKTRTEAGIIPYSRNCLYSETESSNSTRSASPIANNMTPEIADGESAFVSGSLQAENERLIAESDTPPVEKEICPVCGKLIGFIRIPITKEKLYKFHLNSRGIFCPGPGPEHRGGGNG
jgi:hypothetical protein